MIQFNKKYDVPGLAGYSIQGDTYYLDKETPNYFNYKNKKIQIDLPLLVHEIVEKSLMDKLNLDYQVAHELATATEKKFIEQNNISWKQYDNFMQQLISSNQEDQSRGEVDFPPNLEDPSNPGTIHTASAKFIKLSNSYLYITLAKTSISKLTKIIK